MTSQAVQARIVAIDLFERPVCMRLPFRFGVVTLTECQQAFVRVVCEINGKFVQGGTAEIMIPKWFDKTPTLTNEQNTEQLRTSLRIARESYLTELHAQSVWTHSVTSGATAKLQLMATGLPALVAQFGSALLDKALADAVLRGAHAHWVSGVSAGLLGDPYASTLPFTRHSKVQLRHTVGLADRICNAPDIQSATCSDGMPETLEEVVLKHRVSLLKIKLSGDISADLNRLTEIYSTMVTHADITWQVTLDGNENFKSPDHLVEFWRAAQTNATVGRLIARTILLEQPLPRAIALKTNIAACNLSIPVIIDESDDSDQSFDTAIDLGYRGISTKACKGIFRSLHSASIVAKHVGLLLSGEDLMCQAGLGVQQDTLLASSLGVTHIERNGHHFVGGFGTASLTESLAFAQAHPDFYDKNNLGVRLKISDGVLNIASLHTIGFGSAVLPEWKNMAALH